MPRALRRCLYALAALLTLVLAVFGAWIFDSRSYEDRVLRRVTLAGRPVGGLDQAHLEAIVAAIAAEVPTRAVEVSAPGGGFRTDAKALGVQVSGAATVRSALAVGRRGTVPERIVEWAQSFRTNRRAPVRVSVNSNDVYATVSARDPGPRTPATEPSVGFVKGALTAVEGKPGQGIDARDVIANLPKAATDGRTFVVEVDRGDVEPRFPIESAERLAATLQSKVSSPLPVVAGDVKAMVPVATQRSWITSRAENRGLVATVDGELMLNDLAKLLSKAGETAVETSFTVEGEAVRIIDGKSGTKCCSEAAVEIVEGAILDEASTPPEPLPLTERPPDLTVEEAKALGINQPIASFTTKHPGRQPRVANIHRISDLLRGTVILPGKTFSVNDAVGKRTPEKGFVSAPVIEDGKFSESIGGGISQFATTLFNAAFEAGLDFGEYQSHSIYISRYPYGREATLSFPAPDLEIENTSPHGVLIWPTYTDTTITITIFSTKFADVRQSGQSEAPRGACKRVTTERTRTYVADGRVEVDKVFATYRPAEGVNC